MIQYLHHLFKRGDNMSNRKEDKELQEVIAEINEVLNEIKNEQINQKKMMEQNHKVDMKKFSKLIEYNEISDMTNQVFEKRLCSI